MLLDHVKALFTSDPFTVALGICVGLSLALLWGIAYRGRD